MFDPTTNRVPFGLLDIHERKALQSWPHGWEHFRDGKWVSSDGPVWLSSQVYRAKPAPVVKAVWVNLDPNSGWDTREYADTFAPEGRIGVVRVDVIDGKMTVTAERLEVKE